MVSPISCPSLNSCTLTPTTIKPIMLGFTVNNPLLSIELTEPGPNGALALKPPIH